MSPGLQLEHGCLGGLDGLVGLPGGVVVVAGFQQLVDVLLAGLREGVDAPAPERRRPAVRFRGGVRMKLGEGAGGPAVHEMQRRRVLAGDWDEEPGGAGRGHRGRQAFRRLDGRPEFFGQVGLELGVLVVGEPGVLEADLAAAGAFLASLMAWLTRCRRAVRSGSAGRSAGWPSWKARAVSSTGTR